MNNGEKAGYRIATFNIQKFGKLSVLPTETKGRKKDLDTIGKIIRDNQFDIIAIQEIYHKEVLRELLECIAQQYAVEDRLKRGSVSSYNTYSGGKTNESFGFKTKHWEGRWATPNSYNGDSEGYAFIWNRDRIKLVTNRKNEVFEPRIEEYISKGDSLVRPPFLGRFMPVNGYFEIRLINTHVAYSIPAQKKKEDAEGYEPDLTDIEYRKREFLTLIRTVYRRFSQKQYDVNRQDTDACYMPPYTFLLGDYNLNLANANGTSAKLPKEWDNLLIDRMHILTVNEELTTLKNRPTHDPEKEQMWIKNQDIIYHLANNYDHFSYDDKKLAPKGVGAGIARPITKALYPFSYYKDKTANEETVFDLYRAKVSDHVPVYMDFDIRKKRL